MTTHLRTLLLLVMAAAAPLQPSGRTLADESTGDAAVQDLFYLGDEGLVAIRFHLFIDGQPYRAAWAKHLDEMFDRLDADDNRALTSEELRGIPSRSLMENFRMLSGGSVAARLGTEPDAAPRDGKVTRQELQDYFERVGLPPFRIQIDAATNPTRVLRAGMAAPDEAPKALLKHLDVNGDSKLSAEEFLAAESGLRKADLDRDEAISMAELAPVSNLFGRVVAAGDAPQQEPSRFLAITADSRRANVDRLFKQYDGRGGQDKDRRLSADEIGYGRQAFSQFDADGDGQLDFEETSQLLTHAAPQHEVTVRLGTRGRGQTLFELKDQQRAANQNAASLSLDRSQLELSATDDRGSLAAEATLVAQFKNVDRDGNGYLEQQEARTFGMQPALFALIDSDSDGKVFEKEMIAVVVPLFELDRRRLQVQIADRGRDLFRILETSGDGRIGRRELRAAAERMSLWDSGGDGLVEPDEIPQQYRLAVARSTPNLFGRVVASPVAMEGQVRVQSNSAGPAWFNKMDRNGDGDLSQAEFLGTAELFRQLDADADGLVDAQEAAKL